MVAITFAYLISEPFFIPLLPCFMSWGWLTPVVVFPGWYALWFLAGFPQWETLARDQGQVEGRVRLLSPSSLPQAVSSAKPLSSFAPTSAEQPITPTAQLTWGSPLLWI